MTIYVCDKVSICCTFRVNGWTYILQIITIILTPYIPNDMYNRLKVEIVLMYLNWHTMINLAHPDIHLITLTMKLPFPHIIYIFYGHHSFQIEMKVYGTQHNWWFCSSNSIFKKKFLITALDIDPKRNLQGPAAAKDVVYNNTFKNQFKG